jgi:hypothetical protein
MTINHLNLHSKTPFTKELLTSSNSILRKLRESKDSLSFLVIISYSTLFPKKKITI